MKAYTKKYFHLYYRETQNTKCGTTAPLQKVKLLACSASFHPLITVFLRNIFTKICTQLWIYVNLSVTQRMGSYCIFCYQMKKSLERNKYPVHTIGAETAIGSWVVSARETWRRLIVYLYLYHRRCQDIQIKNPCEVDIEAGSKDSCTYKITKNNF